MQNRWLLLGIVGALLIGFAGSALLLIRSLERLPRTEIVVSPPSGWKTGDTQEIAFYFRTAEGGRPLTDLPVHFQIRGPRSDSPPLIKVPLTERQPGCYVARVFLPPGVPEGPFRARLFLPSYPEADLAAFALRLAPPLALVVVPPSLPLFAGETGIFEVAGLDLSTARPLPNLLTRVRAVPPSGLEIVNRTLVTSSTTGTGRFILRLPTTAGPGDFQVHLTAGRVKTSLLFPFQPRPLASLLPDLDRLIPGFDFWHRLLSPGARAEPPAELIWSEPPPVPPPAWEARFIDQRLFITFDQALPSPHRLEIWARNHLMASHALASAAGMLRIPFPGSFPKGLPLRLRIWSASGTTILAEDLVLPPQGDESARTGGPQGRSPVAQLAARLGLSPTEMLRRLLATQCHKPLAFQVSLQDGLLADRLQKWAGAVLLVFPAALALLVGLLLVVGPRRPTPDTPETAWLSWHGRLALVVIGGFLATALATGSTGHPLIGFLLVIWGLSLGYGLHGGHFTFHPRLGAGLLLAWGYLGGLAGIDLLAAQVGLPPDLVWPGRIWIIASFAAASLGLGLIGLLHLPAAGLPVVVSTKAGAGQRLTAFFLRGTWEAAAGLTLALAAAFGGIFWTLEEWDRRHPSPVSLPPPPSARPIPLLAPQISSDLVFQHLAVTPAPPGAPGIMAPSLSLPPLDSWLSRRASPSRFLLLRHRRRWTGRPIRRLEIILETRTFWDRVVDQLLLLPRTPMRLCQEARARCARFPCLDPDEQENEVPVLEALLGDLAQLLLDRIRSRQPLEAALKNALEEVFHRFSQFIYVDPTIKVHVRSAPSLGEAVPDPTEGDVIPLPFLETDSDQEMVPLTPDQLEQCFQPGGELLLTGPRGTAIFQIQPETFTLTRGVSFRPDLEIDLLEIRRRHPLILRLGF
ncbi:MAG: hypothetical protein OZSIB_3094 [Candidatus Ozemobacter sibiricus]|uniref:Uncharacterized protein n=1 Tax=Candidatus Ozemobacter sibiricus TaxID=2268124 RepID=A0A367ZQE5_9BACT|nr:MAG: hypothetical protein OZSIB_3094 [Candidatus Ozemobacter sibiricus]